MNENDNYFGDSDRYKLIYLNDDAIDEEDDDDDRDQFITSFEKEAILARMMSLYVNQLLKNLAFGHHVFHLTMDEIQKLNKLTLKFEGPLSQDSVLEADNLFPNLKSLEIGYKFMNCGCGIALARVCKSYNLRSFSGMPNLIFLKINDITLHSFQGFTNLRHLELINCNLPYLKSEISQAMPNLESINIIYARCAGSEQMLSNFSFESFSKLRRIETHNRDLLNFLDTLPPSLTFLKMEGQKAFKHTNLQILDIGVYRFDAKVLSDLPSLKHLRIRNCNEINLNYEFLSNIESLSISQIGSKTEHVDFSRLLNLKYLELFGEISLTPNSFSELKALEELHLKNQQLTNSDLEGLFSSSKQIHVLDLSNNCINNIELKTFNGLENLTKLDIKGNDLDKIEPGVFLSVFPKVEELVLSAGSRSEASKQEFSTYFTSQFKKVVFV